MKILFYFCAFLSIIPVFAHADDTSGPAKEKYVYIGDEILFTETNYRRGLGILKDMTVKVLEFNKGFKQKVKKLFRADDLTKLSRLLDQILNDEKNFHQQVNELSIKLSALAKKADPKVLETLSVVVDKIHDYFLNPKVLEPYEDYFRNYKKRFIPLKEKYQEFIDENPDQKVKEDFESLAITPIQRWPRYLLLFTDLSTKMRAANQPALADKLNAVVKTISAKLEALNKSAKL